MTIITTEIQKWKRNKIVWCILALTLLLGAFAIERACSISRSSPFMDSFGDLYTLAFKNLSSLFLPIRDKLGNKGGRTRRARPYSSSLRLRRLRNSPTR